MYGIYNTELKKFQFGICEPTKRKAYEQLYAKIGNDCDKPKFIVRTILTHQKTRYKNKRR